MAHQHYKGTGQMHSFRGLLADGGQDKIRIEGATGQIAWRITKFELLPYNVATTASKELIVKIYREEQSAITESVDFTQDELLGAGIFTDGNNPIYANSIVTIFDNALFVRNIWISLKDANGSERCNYYIELEEVKVSAAGMAQLAVAAARRT